MSLEGSHLGIACKQASMVGTCDKLQVIGQQQQHGPAVNCPCAVMIADLFHAQVLEAAYMLYRRRYFLPILVSLCSIVTVTWMSITQRKLNSKVKALMNVVRLTPVVQDR